MRKSERVHPLCPMDNTQKRTGCLFNCATEDGTSERLPQTVYVAGTRPRTFSFEIYCCFRDNLRFQKFFRGTDGYKFLSSIFDEEEMFGPKLFGIIFFS